MRARPWLAVALSYGTFLILLPVFTVLVSREADRIHNRTKAAHEIYMKADDAITDIQASINKGALIAPSAIGNPEQPQARISELQSTTEHDCATLIAVLGLKEQLQVLALQRALDEYWSSRRQTVSTQLNPASNQTLFLELEKQPKKVLEVADSIDALNEASLARQEQEIETQQRQLRRFALVTAAVLFIFECIIATLSTAYMARLDKLSELEKDRTAKAEKELRRLTNQLVEVQEEERKTISRELHDEVGQILTGLRMELGSMSQNDPDEGRRLRLDSVKRLAEEALRSVRNISLLIRPSMLDDLGLESALRWQAKEFTRRCGILVSVNFEGELEKLPEGHRLCLYRAIQEAMTNCGKHADASLVSVSVKQHENLVSASIQDNGRGFNAARPQTRGLGLIGMTERVRALRGKMTVSSSPGSGTLINLEVPYEANGLDFEQ